MKLKQAIHKREQIILSLQDFLNYALRCGHDVNNNLKHFWEAASGVKPATKEQRDLLFQKMKEAGYEWNGEKKVLTNLEKEPSYKDMMIKWNGDNLKEVLDFTGKSKNFDKWFASFADYEKYVHEHNNIFKLFNEDGSHYEVPVGAWIVKTPDGYNVASQAIYKANKKNYKAIVCPKCLKDASDAKSTPAYHNREDYTCPHCGYTGDSVEFETSYSWHPIHSSD